jgi:hypothetical protein
MAKNSDKEEYNCPHCSQTSSRKYNINIHIQRKHHYPRINNANQTPLFNESPDLTNFKKSPSNWNRSMDQQPQSSTFFPPYFTFYPDSSFYYDKEMIMRMKENQEEDSIKHY